MINEEKLLQIKNCCTYDNWDDIYNFLNLNGHLIDTILDGLEYVKKFYSRDVSSPLHIGLYKDIEEGWEKIVIGIEVINYTPRKALNIFKEMTINWFIHKDVEDKLFFEIIRESNAKVIQKHDC